MRDFFFFQKRVKMKILHIFGVLLICNVEILHSISVGKFINSYMNAQSNSVRKMLVDEMLGDINEKPINEIFDDYDEKEEQEYQQMLKNRDFLRKEDREHLNNVLKYTKVASTNWGKILLHPEKIPNPTSFLQWDMKKFIKRLLMNPEARNWISDKLLKDIEISDRDKFQQELKQQLGENFNIANDYINSILMPKNVILEPNFQSWVRPNETRMCMDSLEGTWGYPLDVLGQIIKLIGWQIIQTLITDLPDLCSTDPGSSGAIAIQLLCGILGLPDDQCQTITDNWGWICPVFRLVVSVIEIRPLQEQRTLIPTIASKYNFIKFVTNT